VIDQKREHVYGRDCWCNPLVVANGAKVLAPFSGTVVRWEPIGANEAAIHIEPSADPPREVTA
jgi:hypothetical protein